MPKRDPATGRVYPDEMVERLSDAGLASRVARDRAVAEVVNSLEDE